MKWLCLVTLFILPLIGYGDDNLNTFIEMQKPHYQTAREEGMSDSELCFLFPFLHHSETKRCSQEIQKIYVVTELSIILKTQGAGIIKEQKIVPLKEPELTNVSYLITSLLKKQKWNMEDIITTANSSSLTPFGPNITDIANAVQNQLTYNRLK